MKDFRDSAWADNRFAESYLERADIYIIDRREMFGVVSSLFGHFRGGRKNARVLDLGCGDGVLTGELLKTDDSLSATLIDGNEGMLKKAGERLKAYGKLRYVKASFQDILRGDIDPDPGGYDFCVSSMAIHHLDMAEKASLFRYIMEHLKPGGRFVNVDVVLPPSEELEGWYFAVWKKWLGRMMDRFKVSDESPEDLISRYKDPSSLNRPDTLEDQLSALRQAGFSEADCYFKNGIFVVFGGKR